MHQAVTPVIRIFSVTETGKAHELDNLPDQDNLPWWMADMRPQGYLGRAWSTVNAASLGLAADLGYWYDSDVLHALAVLGPGTVGNLLIGELAYNRHMGAMPLVVSRSDYPDLAQIASTGAITELAGGVQPKFCAYSARGHMLVKFSMLEDTSASERWRDLLLAEHLALSVLGVETEIFDFGVQRFLEVPRFDRIGKRGRVGVFSLSSLDAEFVGDASAPWPSLVKRLAAGGHVHADAVAGSALLWAFGVLIGNTDMHAGNLSFIGSHGRPYKLAPAYDMLPMAFSPRRSSAIVDVLPPASLSSSVDGESWRNAMYLAERFMALVSESDGFSDRFRPCISAVRRHIDEAKSRIVQLP